MFGANGWPIRRFLRVQKSGNISRALGFSWFTNKLLQNELVYVATLDELPAEAKHEKDAMKKDGIQSLILIPIQSREKIIGFLGFDQITPNKSWRMDDPELLARTGQYSG